MEEGHQRIVNAVESMEIMKKMKEFDESQEIAPCLWFSDSTCVWCWKC